MLTYSTTIGTSIARRLRSVTRAPEGSDHLAEATCVSQQTYC